MTQTDPTNDRRGVWALGPPLGLTWTHDGWQTLATEASTRAHLGDAAAAAYRQQVQTFVDNHRAARGAD